MPKHDYDEKTIIVRDKLYIPIESVDADEIIKAYTHYMYDEKSCARCPNKPMRHNFECDQCAAFKGAVATCNTVYKNEIEYVGLPLGDRLNYEKKFGIDLSEFSFIDMRVKEKFDYPVKLRKSFQLRDYQEEAENAWWEYKHGLIVAPPRSGKTPTMLHLAVRLGLRVILLANQHEFLTQFIEHVEELTNLPHLENKYGVKLYGFPKTLEDFDTMQIAVCTYQQFQNTAKGRKRYAAAKRNFGTVMIDEAHKANSNEFARVVSRWPSRIRLGVTGTDKRKDGRHILMKEIVGPAQARVEIDQLEAKILVHVCDYVKSRSKFRGPAGFVYACKFLGNHEKRMDEILEWILKDLGKGHSIVIPVYYRDQVFDLVKRINDLAGSEVAEPFVGGGSKKNKDAREMTIERARSGKTKVVVGIRSILQLGHNVPRWSALYYIMPMSNEPNWKQESSRVLTPMDGKRQPIIRMFVDPNIGLSLGCFVSTYKSSMKFKHRPTDAARERAAEMFEIHGAGRRDMEDAEAGVEIDYSEDDKYAGRRKKEKKRPKNDKAPSGLFNRR